MKKLFKTTQIWKIFKKRSFRKCLRSWLTQTTSPEGGFDEEGNKYLKISAPVDGVDRGPDLSGKL